jgi:cell division septation protein DedD
MGQSANNVHQHCHSNINSNIPGSHSSSSSHHHHHSSTHNNNNNNNNIFAGINPSIEGGDEDTSSSSALPHSHQEIEQFQRKRAGHYNEFKVLQAMRQKMKDILNESNGTTYSTSAFTRFFHGTLDELWIFARPLTSFEIGELSVLGAPTSQPSSQPSRMASGQPTSQPTGQPSKQPTSKPTNQPSRQPSSQPTRQPSSRPTSQPSRQPSRQPTGQPSSMPTFRIISTTLKEGLIAFYTFDGDANDNSGNANHGTIHKGVTFVPDRLKTLKVQLPLTAVLVDTSK